MSTFASGTQEEKPTRVVVVGPSSFAFDWRDKPSGEVAIGLRAVSERDVQVAKGQASQWMIQVYGEADGSLRDPDKAFESWNDRFVAYVLALACCDVNSARKAYFHNAEDAISKALTSEAMRVLWGEYTLMTRITGDRVQLDDDGAEVLGKALERGALRALEANVQAECRKALAWVSEQLAAAGALEGDEDESESVYTVASAAPPSLT